jgi:hypothetical protein
MAEVVFSAGIARHGLSIAATALVVPASPGAKATGLVAAPVETGFQMNGMRLLRREVAA